MCWLDDLWRRLQLWRITVRNPNPLDFIALIFVAMYIYYLILKHLFFYGMLILIILVVVSTCLMFLWWLSGKCGDVNVIQQHRRRALGMQGGRQHPGSEVHARSSTRQEYGVHSYETQNIYQSSMSRTDRMLRGFRPQPHSTGPISDSASSESARPQQRNPISWLFGKQRQSEPSSATQDSSQRIIPTISITYPEPRRPIGQHERYTQPTSLVNFGASTSRDTTESYHDDSYYRTPPLLLSPTSQQTDFPLRHFPERYAATSQQTGLPGSQSPERHTTVAEVHLSPSISEEMGSEDGSPGKRSIASSKGSEGSPSSNMGSDASHCSDDSTKASKGSPSSNRASDYSPENSDDSDSPGKSKSAKVQKRSAEDEVARYLLGTPAKERSKGTPRKRKESKQSSCGTRRSTRSASKTRASNIPEQQQQQEAAGESLDPACSDAHPKERAKSESTTKSSNVPSTPTHSTVILRSPVKVSTPIKRKKSFAQVHRSGVKGCDPPLEKKPKTTSGSSSESESEV